MRNWLPVLCLGVVLLGCAGGESAPAALTERSGSASDAAGSTETTAREVIRRGSLSIEVNNLAEAEAKAMIWVKQEGGYIENAQSSDLNSVRASIQLSLRVPSAKFDAAFREFESLGTLVSKQISSQDVTTQLVDLRARLKVLREQEQVLVGFLRNSKTLKDSLAVNAELTKIRQEIESMDALLRSQEQLVALSTLEVNLLSPAQVISRTEGNRWAQDAWTASTDSFVGVARGLGSFGIGALVFAPLWLPAIGIAWWWRRRKSTPPRG